MPKRINISIIYPLSLAIITMPRTKKPIARAVPNKKVFSGSNPPLKIEPNNRPPNDNLPKSSNKPPIVVPIGFQFLAPIKKV